MKCGKCGKEMEIQGLNRTWPPKKDDMGRDVCPHCAHPNGPPRGATGFGTFGYQSNASTVAENPMLPGKQVDWLKLVDDLNKAMRQPGKIVAVPDPTTVRAVMILCTCPLGPVKPHEGYYGPGCVGRGSTKPADPPTTKDLMAIGIDEVRADIHRASQAFFARMPYIDDIIFGDEPFVPDLSTGGAFDELDECPLDSDGNCADVDCALHNCDDADDDSEEFDCPCFYDDDEEAYQ